VDKVKMPREFKIIEDVFLKLNPKTSSLMLGSCMNIAVRLFGPFEILDRIGKVSYMISFPYSMKVNNVIDVSFFKNNVHESIHVNDFTLILVEEEADFRKIRTKYGSI
jgi:hypothetical protein